MSNVTNSLWVNYFRYYYRDTWHGQSVRTGNQLGAGDRAKADYGNTKYSTGPSSRLPDGRPGGAGKFGLNNNQSVPFFNAVTIYQLNARRFTSYILVNPLIEAWEHDQLDQSQGSKFAQSRCTMGYETVFYGEGRVARDTPSGFATFHYDLTPSPLSLAGGGNNSIFGPGGILQGSQDLFGATDKLLSGNSISSLGSIASIGIQGSNLIRNFQNVSSESLRAEGQSILNSAIKGAIAGGGPGSGILGGILGGGLGSLGKSLGFGPQVGTILDGANFVPNKTEAVAGAVGEPSPTPLPQINNPQLSAEKYVLTANDYADMGTTPESLQGALADQEAKAYNLMKEIEVASTKKVEVDAAVAKAVAADGPQAGILVRETYAAQGYISPEQYQQQLQTIYDNKYQIQQNLDMATGTYSKYDQVNKEAVTQVENAVVGPPEPTLVERTINSVRTSYREFKEAMDRTPVDLTEGLSPEQKLQYEQEKANRPWYQKIPFIGISLEEKKIN
jgi:hypothetical protein